MWRQYLLDTRKKVKNEEKTKGTQKGIYQPSNLKVSKELMENLKAPGN